MSSPDSAPLAACSPNEATDIRHPVPDGYPSLTPPRRHERSSAAVTHGDRKSSTAQLHTQRHRLNGENPRPEGPRVGRLELQLEPINCLRTIPPALKESS